MLEVVSLVEGEPASVLGAHQIVYDALSSIGFCCIDNRQSIAVSAHDGLNFRITFYSVMAQELFGERALYAVDITTEYGHVMHIDAIA